MASSITSTGFPTFKSVPPSQARPEPTTTDITEGTSSTNIPDGPQHIERRLRTEQKLQLQQSQEELIDIKMLDSAVQTATTGGEDNPLRTSPGMKAIRITREKGSTNQFNFSVLQVNSRANSEVIFESDSLDEIQKLSPDKDLDLRGELFDRAA